jgi:hypothetical protein
MSISDHIHHPNFNLDLSRATDAHHCPIAIDGQRNHLLGFPVELLIEIISSLRTTRDLAACSQTCKTFHKLVEPILYRSFDSVQLGLGAEYLATKDIKPFVLALLSRPELARHVKSVNIGIIEDMDNTGNDDSEPGLAVCTPREEELLLQALSKFERANPDSWMEELGRGSAEAYAALLLAEALNLEEYSFTAAVSNGTPLIEGVFNMALQGIVLGNLEKLHMIHYDTEGGICFDHYTTLLQIPSLRELHATMVDESWEEQVRMSLELSTRYKCSQLLSILHKLLT